MVRLILGRAGTGKTARIFHEIAESVRNRQGGMILLVPEQYSHEAERELCREAGDTLSLYGEVLSFTGLARKVFAQCGGARPVMDRGGRLLCMAVAAEEVAGNLRVYHRSRRDPRLLDMLLGAVEELKNSDISAESLTEAASRAEGELGEKLRDLSLVREAYTAAERRSAADPADILQTLAGLIGDSISVEGTFYIDGFSDFTALEKNVLRELIRADAPMTVCLTCGGTDEGMFALPEQTARWFAAAAAEYGVECTEEWMEAPEGETSPLVYYTNHLFDFAPGDPPENNGAIRLVTAADIYEECELAAARMSELARAGCRWRDMAVAVRGFGDYRTALESACIRYGVPLFLSGQGDMLRKSVPLLLVNALEAVNRGWEYDAVFGCLKTGLMPLSAEECDRLEEYVILWGIRGSMWQRCWTMHPEGYNHPMDGAAEETLAQLNALRERIVLPLKALEDGIKAAETAARQAMALGDFLVRIRLPERLQERAEELEASGRRETAAEYGRLWDVVCNALEQFASVLGEQPMDGERFQGLFSLMLSKYDVNVIPVSLDSVQAGEIDGMRRRHTKHLFVLGALDGRLPAPETACGVFTPEEREVLSELGFAMGGAEEDFSRELGRIYSCLSLPSEGLYISWPAVDGEGGESRPSVIAERARALFGLRPERGNIRQARTFSREAAFALAVQGQAGDDAPECLAARDYFSRNGRADELRRILRAASAGRGSLDAASVRALYGERPGLSATRAEKFVNCRFGYFLQYGLRAKPRQQAVFDPRDYGTFMHYVLENVAREVLAEGGFSEATAAQIGALSDKYVDKYIREEMNDFAEKSARFEYLFRRLRATVHRVTEDMWQELKNSRFQPIDLELDLTGEGVLDPEEEAVRLTGRIDRVDGWVKDGVLYLRVTDYKTGVKKFSLSDVCEGINLQMLLYLFTLEKRGKSHYQVHEIRPAGVLYSPARYDLVSADSEVSEEELAELRRNTAKRSGLILSDPAVLEAMEPGEEKRFLPIKLTKAGAYSKDSEKSLATLEQFGALSRYIDGTLKKLAAELRAGSVTADPWFKNARDTACAYCDYKEACLFDETKDGWRMRTSLTPSAAWERIGKEHE